MPNFLLPAPGFQIMVKDAGIHTFGVTDAVVSIDEGALANALRQCQDVIELDGMPPESVRKFMAAQEKVADYPLPDFTAKPVVLVGRGPSSEGFQHRYPRSHYIRVGIQPGSFPRSPDVSSAGRHLDVHGEFDAITVFDGIWPLQCGQQFQAVYRGPIISLEAYRTNIIGPGTFYDGLPVCRNKHPGLSINFSLYFLEGIGCKTVILCGTDMADNHYRGLRSGVLRVIEEVRGRGMEVWRDALCPFELAGNIWPPHEPAKVIQRGNRVEIPRPRPCAADKGRFLIAGMGASFEKRKHMLADSRFTVIGCNTALRRIVNPDVWLVTDPHTMSVYAAEAAQLNPEHTKIWGRKDAIRSLPYPVSRLLDYPVNQETAEFYGRSGAGVAMRTILADGATEIHLIGMDGYNPYTDIGLLGGISETECRNYNSYGAAAFLDCMKSYPNTKFVWYDESAFLNTMPRPLPENCHHVIQ